MEIEKHKKCFKCGEHKPLSHFYKHSRMKDGHLNKCKICTKKDVNKNRQENLEYYQEHDRQRGRDKNSERTLKTRARAKLPENIEKSRLAKRKSAAKYPEKTKCRQMFSNAIRDKRIVRPTNCEFCGKECIPHGHHSSYSKDMAFMVTWLCTACHGEIHRLYE